MFRRSPSRQIGLVGRHFAFGPLVGCWSRIRLGVGVLALAAGSSSGNCVCNNRVRLGRIGNCVSIHAVASRRPCNLDYLYLPFGAHIWKFDQNIHDSDASGSRHGHWDIRWLCIGASLSLVAAIARQLPRSAGVAEGKW